MGKPSDILDGISEGRTLGLSGAAMGSMDEAAGIVGPFGLMERPKGVSDGGADAEKGGRGGKMAFEMPGAEPLPPPRAAGCCEGNGGSSIRERGGG